MIGPSGCEFFPIFGSIEMEIEFASNFTFLVYWVSHSNSSGVFWSLRTPATLNRTSKVREKNLSKSISMHFNRVYRLKKKIEYTIRIFFPFFSLLRPSFLLAAQTESIAQRNTKPWSCGLLTPNSVIKSKASTFRNLGGVYSYTKVSRNLMSP